jgi:hypothetical protein
VVKPGNDSLYPFHQSLWKWGSLGDKNLNIFWTVNRISRVQIILSITFDYFFSVEDTTWSKKIDFDSGLNVEWQSSTPLAYPIRFWKLYPLEHFIRVACSVWLQELMMTLTDELKFLALCMPSSKKQTLWSIIFS